MQIADPTKIVIAVLGGLLPALFWLWFWLREDRENPEPIGLIVLTFFLGAGAVAIVLPIEKYIQGQPLDKTVMIVLWATTEEFFKYLAVYIVAFKSSYLDEPLDYPIYLIATAMGFAALENALFLMHPLGTNDTITSLLTGNLRFLGATLLHATSSAIIGISLGLSYFDGWFSKKIHLIMGLAGAIALHSIFNFFIIENNGKGFLGVFAFLWVVTIIIMLLFEKLRRMSQPN